MSGPEFKARPVTMVLVFLLPPTAAVEYKGCIWIELEFNKWPSAEGMSAGNCGTHNEVFIKLSYLMYDV
jgi:hypothetical protein